jgi:chemotaxis-related protein WspB
MLVLTFQVGGDRLALDVRRVQEVVPRVRLQAIAHSPPWLAGVFVYRGRVVPVIDLHRLVGAGECPPHLSTRIILVARSHEGSDGLLGLLAAQVHDIRDMTPPSEPLSLPRTPGQPDLGPVLVDGRELVHLVEMDRLLPELYGRSLALMPKELPA